MDGDWLDPFATNRPSELDTKGDPGQVIYGTETIGGTTEYVRGTIACLRYFAPSATLNILCQVSKLIVFVTVSKGWCSTSMQHKGTECTAL